MTAHRIQAARWHQAFVWSVLLVASAFPDVALAQTARSLSFNGSTSQYVTFGKAYSLQASSFTLEVWFKRSGTGGAQTSTGGGGWANIVPLIAKGRGEAETPDSLNTNYFLGIRSDGILAADFEEPSGPNHPIGGATVVTNGVWNHAALSYNVSTGRYTLYLNGNIEKDTTLTPGITPAFNSIQHASLGTAMTSTGVQAGGFLGLLDEPRIWNVARTQAEIQSTMNVEVLSAPGLIGHWSLNEGSGSTALCSTVNGPIGTLAGPPTVSTDAAVPLLTATGLRFGSAGASYASFGNNAALGLPQFTLETWFRRDGKGVHNQTGTGGLPAAIPLITKGRNQAESPANLNMNYYLGIDTLTATLCADFEDVSGGDNHPIYGTTPIVNGVWYHAAVTYDGTSWRLYLNGNLEATDSPGEGAEGTSVQHAGLGTAMTSDGTPAGFFNGLLDEARIWNVARSQASIQSTMNSQLTGPMANLVARWGMNEDAGLTIANSAGGTITGTLSGTNWSWGTNSPFDAPLPPPPADPSALSATPVSPSRIDLAWTDNATNEAAYEVERSTTGIGGPYTLLVSLAEGATSYSNTGLTASTEYCYRVRAINGGGASGYAGPTCATTPQPPAPNPPSNLAATAVTYGQIHLTWTDNASDETSFELERSTSGSGGPFTPLATLTANTVAYDDLNLTGGLEYCYRVRAVNGNGGSAYATVACATTPAPAGRALDFSRTTNTYASFGNPAALHLNQVTLEMWMRRDGDGAFTNTGTFGIDSIIPLIAKGRAEAEDPLKDINYIIGLRASNFTLCADFEEGAGGDTLSKNHPVYGNTPIGTGVWHHVAATYDGTWKLYLDGQLNGQIPVNRPLGSASNVAVAIASALNSSGTAAGYFDGVLDEVRIWSAARTESEIRSTINSQLTTSQPNLVARWSLDENSGTIINATPTTVNGSIIGTSFAWVAGAPFDLVVTPPNPPSGLAATAPTYSHVHLTWNDNSTDETSFVIERSTSGIGGTYTTLATLPAGTTTHDDVGLSAGTEYCYRVHAANAIGSSADDGPICVTTPTPAQTALDFGGNAYAVFGNPAALQLSNFTIEMWMRRDGDGTGTNTGMDGIPDAIPLLTKGRAENENANVDINYFFGIRKSDGVLCIDFEEGAAGGDPSQNHPSFGVTPLPSGGGWHHVAATYDGSAMKLYLDGALESSNTIGQPLAAASTVAVALGSALNSGNTAAGFFDGAVDEVRVWNVARSAADIQAVYNAAIPVPASGLVARWAVDEGYGATVGASSGTTASGTLNGTYSWLQGGVPVGTLATLAASATHVDVACYGGSDGSIDLSVSGGVPPYTYAWSNSASTQDLSGLAAGSYTVTVTDATGATANSGATVDQPAQLVANAVATPVSVFGGGDGMVDLSVSGGTTPYTYAWSNGATTEDLTGVIAGSYTVTVTDAHGCTANAGATVTQPDELVASATHVDVSCFGGSDGSIDLSVSGGVPPYTYAWSNGATSQDLSGLTAGIYTVTVTDANGATANSGATVDQPAQLVANATATPVSIFGGSDGAVDLTVSGGTTPYTYAWSNGATTEDLTGVIAGSYTVTVTDAHGCTANAGATVTEPGQLSANAIATDVSCFGGSDGSIDLSVSGGVPPYTYAWNNAATTEDLSGLSAGTYTVTVTDANGATANAGATVGEPTQLLANAIATPVTINGASDGAVDLSVSGGTTPYTYAWSNGATSEDLTGVIAGSYTVTVTDAHGCIANAGATVTQPDELVANAIGTDASCFGGSDGSIDLSVSGGVPPYTYAWSNGATIEDLNSLAAGSYTVTVTDANGASANAGATVGEPAQLVANTVATPVTTFGGSDGAVDLTVSGGTTPYTYAWSNSATTEDLTGVIAGSYTVTVTDAHGCTANAEATVTEPAQLVANATHVDVTCFGGSNGSIDLSVSGGVPPYTYAWSNGATTQDLSGLTAGTYAVSVTDANGATANSGATIEAPAMLVVDATQGDPIHCQGGTTTVTVSATGGTPPYSGAGTFTVVSGNHTYVVTDANGCTAEASIMVDDPGPATPPAAPTNLVATALDAYRVDLTWTDASTTEDGFQIARSDMGEQGPFVVVSTVGPDVTSYQDLPLEGATEFTYLVRAVRCSTFSDSALATVTTATEPCMALDLTPGGHVQVPSDAALELAQFSLELWIRRDGAGVGTSTGNGGIADAIPLIARGRDEDDDEAHNTNYLLGIRQSDGVLCADFEEGPSGSSPGASHPILGTTAIGFGTWHHVAATYDGANWSLYLDGNLEATLAVNQPASATSDVRVALGSALNSASSAAGFFDGAIDEVRIWKLARTQSEIQGAMNQTLSLSDPNLVGRWAFDESFGSTAFSTSGIPVHGSISGVAGAEWDRVACGGWVTGVDEPAITAVSFARVAPNPTRGATRFEFALPRAAQVELEIHDVLGRHVATVAHGEFAGGMHRLAWNGASDTGGPAPNGMYYARFRSGRTVTTKAFVILR